MKQGAQPVPGRMSPLGDIGVHHCCAGFPAGRFPAGTLWRSSQGV